jgi:hypothetical protein
VCGLGYGIGTVNNDDTVFGRLLASLAYLLPMVVLHIERVQSKQGFEAYWRRQPGALQRCGQHAGVEDQISVERIVLFIEGAASGDDTQTHLLKSR